MTDWLLFAIRCFGVTLAIFVLLYISLSLAVSKSWRLVTRATSRLPIQHVADLLFLVRILPLIASAIVTLALTLPSFLLLEPLSVKEPVGALPLTLGFCSLIILAFGISQAVQAQRRASRAMSQWLHEATVLETRSQVPVFRTGNHAPALTVAGVYAPRVLISDAALFVLSDRELQTALQHELAHVRRYDNLKKLFLRFSTFPGMTELEAAWSEATEMAADDSAVSSVPEALDLAAALIKLSRLATPQPCAQLSTLLPASSASLRARVERLFTWNQDRIVPDALAWRYSAPVLLLTAVCAISIYSQMLVRMHSVTEWLVR